VNVCERAAVGVGISYAVKEGDGRCYRWVAFLSGRRIVLFDIRVEDQDHSARLLRAGVVMGAVTTERRPVAGCRVQRLGVFRRRGAGWGWLGMFPEKLAAAELAKGSFVRIADEYLDVPLFWQCWKLNSPMGRRTTEVVRTAAADLRRHLK
jgi:hypothetical protein